MRAFATPENQQLLAQLLQEFGAGYKRVRLEGLTAEDSSRQHLLQEFDATPDDEVFVLASCRTIGEGVDTKNANMVFFADPKGSYAATIQAVGRATRRNPHDGPDATGTVVLMVHINMAKYRACATDAERDTLLRDDLRGAAGGSFEAVTNFLLALKEEDGEFLQYGSRALKHSRNRQPAEQQQHPQPAEQPEQPQTAEEPAAADEQLPDPPAQQQRSRRRTKQAAAGSRSSHNTGSSAPRSSITAGLLRRFQFDFSLAPGFEQIFRLADAQADEAGAAEGSAFLEALLLGTPRCWARLGQAWPAPCNQQHCC